MLADLIAMRSGTMTTMTTIPGMIRQRTSRN
jgi:hypothetical protein